MKELAYYSIVRFMPYVETEEFVNAGVVMLCPKTGWFGFKLAHRRTRANNFFESLDTAIYRNSLNKLDEELERVRQQLHGLKAEAAEAVFGNLTEPRESLLRFRQPRAVLTADPQQELADKFGHYVEHDFAGKAYQERLMEQAIRGVLQSAKLQQRFQSTDVGTADFHLRLPLVHLQGERAVAAIKPLFLGDSEPTGIYDKGAHWAGKLKLLREIGGFDGKLMFVLQPPESGTAALRAFETTQEALAQSGALTTLVTNQDALIGFARTH
jgi:hypothetical protein